MTIGAAQSSHLGRMCRKHECSKRWDKSMTTMRTRIRKSLIVALTQLKCSKHLLQFQDSCASKQRKVTFNCSSNRH